MSSRQARMHDTSWLNFLAWLLLWAGSALAADTPELPGMADNPLAGGIQALLREGVHPKLRWSQFPDMQPALQQLYQGNQFRPLWTREGRANSQAKAVVASLAEAGSRGLNPEDYDARLLHDWVHQIDSGQHASPQNLASFDVALSLELMRYASSLYVGRVNPQHVNFGLDIAPKKLDLPALLRELASRHDPAERIAALEPKLKLYESLKHALARYQQLAAANPEPPQFSFPAKFKPGDRHPEIKTLRLWMTTLGDMPESAHDTDTYDKELAAGVKNFQKRHGLAADGVIGKTTLAALNYPLSARVKQIQLGLERLRWLPERFEGRYIIVNIPSFELFAFSDDLGRPDLKMNVIVGEAINGRNTPVFHSDMTYVNFRPYWNVPYKITAKEYLPLIMRNPGYLARNNMEIVPNFSPNAPVYEANLDTIAQLSTGALKLRQRPGPKNALGLVKFAFPNTNNVYLHSTPTQGLFKKARRDFSHGCIRVEDPVGLAEYVLAEQTEPWSRERIEEAMKADKPKIVSLKKSLPVYLFYSTVLADDSGDVMFFNDIYGHDQILEDLLAKGFPYPA